VLGRRLARCERQVPPLPVELPPYAERWCEAAGAILQAMPAEHRAPVLAELLAGPAQTPLAQRVSDMARRAAYQAETSCARPYRGPLVIPPAVCRLLTELPAGVVQFSCYECAQCGLELPFPEWRAGRAVVPAPVGQVSYLDTCPHCDGAEFGWYVGPSGSQARE
jgi:hypothetical protein